MQTHRPQRPIGRPVRRHHHPVTYDQAITNITAILGGHIISKGTAT
jgi:hypothetical protein